MSLEAEELKAVGEAVKEVLDERLGPLEERLTKVEATKADGGVKPSGVNENADDDDKDDSVEAEDVEDTDVGEQLKDLGLSEEVKKAIDKATKEALEPVTSELDELKTGINRMVGASKSIVGEDDEEADDKSATKAAPRRDAWGRKVHKARS